MTREEAVALLERYSNYDGMGIPNLAGCKEAMKVAVESLKEVYPELRESEDERIRKKLYNTVLGTPNDNEWFQDISKDAILAYLEKQKDQRPVEWKPQSESLEALMYAIEGKWDMIKPTSYLSRRLEDLYEGLVNTYNVDEPLIAELPKTAYTAKDIKELRALKAKIEASMDEAPAEWSEEDEKNLELVTDCVYEFYPDPVMKYKLKDWLTQRFKFIRPQPHWKPSEEQMEALRKAVNKLADTEVADSVRLSIMYDHLSKGTDVIL